MSSRHASLVVSVACVVAPLAGCDSVVVSPCDGDPDCCTSDCTTEPPPPDDASDAGIAVRLSDLRSDVDPWNETVVLMFGSGAEACEDPGPALAPCPLDYTWRAEIPLPVELQYPGATMDLGRLRYTGYDANFEDDQGDADGSCGGGDGFLWGRIDVLSIDDTALTFRYTDKYDHDFDGTRTVPFCGHPPPQVGTAIAVGDDRMAALYGEGRGAGWLHVFVDASDDSLGLSCSDPYARADGCDIERRVVRVSLGPDAQTMGTHAVGSDVAVATSQSGPNGPLACYADMGDDWADGTVEILSVDESSVHFRVQSSSSGPFEGTAARCD